MKLPKILALLLLLTAASCVSVQKPLASRPVAAASDFQCPGWPVVALLTAPDDNEQWARVHELAEPAHQECACRLYVRGLAEKRLGDLEGDLGPPPFGCELTPEPESVEKPRVRHQLNIRLPWGPRKDETK